MISIVHASFNNFSSASLGREKSTVIISIGFIVKRVTVPYRLSNCLFDWFLLVG
jgi:hypothetical protein